jgi:dTMP kinase
VPFVAVEGIDGSGKSSLARGVAASLESSGQKVLLVREPGSTPLGEGVREILLSPTTGELHVWAEACLFVAARAELVRREIRPALAEGRWVITDRYFYSTLAYQGGGGGADIETLRRLNLEAVGGLVPDRVFLLDLPVETARERRQRPADRIEARGADYADRVRRSFLAEAERDPSRFLVLDARLTMEECERRARLDLLNWQG